MCECCWHGDCRSRAQHSEQARITRQQQPKSTTVKRCSHSRPPVLKQGVGLRPQRWYGYSNWDQRAHGESPMHQARDGAQAAAAVCRTLFTRKRIHNNAQTQKPQAQKKENQTTAQGPNRRDTEWVQPCAWGAAARAARAGANSCTARPPKPLGARHPIVHSHPSSSVASESCRPTCPPPSTAV